MALPAPNVTTDPGDTFGDIKGSLLEIANDILLQKKNKKELDDLESILAAQQLNQQRYGERSDLQRKENIQTIKDENTKLIENTEEYNRKLGEAIKEGFAPGLQRQIELLTEINETIKNLQLKSDIQYANVIEHQDEVKMIANQQLLLDNQVLKLEDKRDKKESRALVKADREETRLASLAAFDQPKDADFAETLKGAPPNIPPQKETLLLPPPDDKKSGFFGWAKKNAKAIAAGMIGGSTVAIAYGYQYFKEIPDIRKRLEQDLKDGVISQEKFDAKSKALNKQENETLGGLGGSLAGAAGGALLGAKVGAFLGPLGAIAGAGIGALGGALLGGSLGEYIGGLFGGDDDEEEAKVDENEKFANRKPVKFPKKVKAKLGLLKSLPLGSYFVDPVPNKRGNYHLYPKQTSLSSVVITDPRAKAYIAAKLDDPNAKTEVELAIEKEESVKEFKMTESVAMQGGEAFIDVDDSATSVGVPGGENFSRRVSKSTLVDPEDLKEEPGTIGKAIDSVKGFFGLETLAEKEERMQKELADKRLEVLDTSLKKEDDLLKAEKELAAFEATTKTAQKKKVFFKETEGGGFMSSSEGFDEFVDPALQKKQEELQKAVSEKKKDLIATNAAIVSADIVAATGGGAELDDDASVDNMFGEMTKAGIDIRAFIKAGPMTKEEAADYQTAITSKGGSYDLFLVNVKGYDEFGVPDGIYDLRREAIKKAYEKFKKKQLASEKDARRDDLKAIASAGLDEDDDKKPQEGFFAFLKRGVKDVAAAGLTLAGMVKEKVKDIAADQERNVKNLLRTDVSDALDTMETDIAGEQQKMGLEDGFAPGQLRDVGSGAGISSPEGLMEGGPADGYFQAQAFMEGGDPTKVSTENVAAAKTDDGTGVVGLPSGPGSVQTSGGPGGLKTSFKSNFTVEQSINAIKKIPLEKDKDGDFEIPRKGPSSEYNRKKINAELHLLNLRNSGAIDKETYSYARFSDMGNALNAIQEGGISGLKTFVKKAKEGKRIDKTIDKLTNISKSLSDNPENFDLGKTTDALAKTVVPELPNVMKGVKDKMITPFVEMGQKSLAMPFSMESGIGNPNERAIVDNMVTKSKEAMPALDKAIADAEQLKKDQENKAGIFAPQNMNNDNSTTNINNTKNITPIIAANQNGSYNNVGKGNMAFR